MNSLVGEPTTMDADEDDTSKAADLASIALPLNAIRRIARSGAPPGTRFSGDAFAALHRICQAYILWATDRSMKYASAADDAKNQKKARGKTAAPPAGKNRLTAAHVMRFLERELPQIASKVSTLFPDIVPPESRPTAIRLLEQYREQEQLRRMTVEGHKEANNSVEQISAPAEETLQPQSTGKREAVDSAEAAPAKKRKGVKASTPSVASFFVKRASQSQSDLAPPATTSLAEEQATAAAVETYQAPPVATSSAPKEEEEEQQEEEVATALDPLASSAPKEEEKHQQQEEGVVKGLNPLSKPATSMDLALEI